MPAIVENMAFAGALPWHGLGQELNGEETSEQVMVAAGLDWTVGTQPLYRKSQDGQGFELVPHARTSVRESDNSILGIVGKRWTPLQNVESFKVFEPLVEQGLMSWHTAGSLRDGQRVWVLCQLNLDNSVIVPGDEIRKFALLSNGHDGKLAVHFGFTPIRVVCANTEAMARNSEASKLIRIRHHRLVAQNVEKLRDIMDCANQDFEASCDDYRFLASQPINQADLKKYVRIVFKLQDKKEDDVSTRQTNICNRVEELFETGKGAQIDGVKGTYWAAYNAVSEYLNFEKGRNEANRVDSLWFGQNAVQSRDALTTALALAS